MTDEEKELEVTPEASADEADAEVTLARAGASALAEKGAGLDDELFGENEGQLAIDVYQTPDEIIIESPVAGVAADDLDVAITNESVTIRGKREHAERVREDDYFYQECYWGRFSRSVVLPQEIDAERAEASIKNGILTVHLPKLRRTKSKRIKVKFD